MLSSYLQLARLFRSKYSQHDVEELIAIVYDGTYKVFESLYHVVKPKQATEAS